jgi:hypothetical protein
VERRPLRFVTTHFLVVLVSPRTVTILASLGTRFVVAC